MNQMQQQAELQKINVHEIMQKFQTKKELYDWLTQDCKLYLPKLDCINVFYLKAIVRGQKENLKRQSVKIAAVPQIEGLTTEDFLEHAKKKAIILKYLPDEKDWHHLDKKWVCDIVYSLDTDGTQQMINNAMNKRKQRLEQSQDLLVEMKPEFAEAIKNCNNFSTSKGRTAYLLKPTSKTKRKRSEIEDVRDEEQLLNKDKQMFLKGVKKLRTDKDKYHEEVTKLKHVETMMENLVRQGVIDPKGILINKK